MAAAGLNENITLYVNGKPVGGSTGTAALNETILDIELERTITGASTITVKNRDPERVLQHQGFFEAENTEAKIDGLDFVACSFSKRQDEYELRFEDREFYLLAQDKTYRSAERKHGQTRAQFVKRVCHEVCPHVEFICPELNVQQPSEGPKGRASKARGKGKKAVAAGGVTAGSIKIEGQGPDPDQLSNINVVLQVCQELNAPTNARLAILCAGIAESNFRTHDRNPREGADGVFQLIPSTAASTGLSPFNTKATAEHWLKTGYYGKGGGIALANAGKSVGEIAEAVEGAAVGPEFFEKHKANAEEILSVGKGGAVPSKNSHQVEVVHLFAVNKGGGEDENTLQGLERLATEVKWRFFVSRGKFFFLQDATLLAQKPSLELDETSPGVIDISWELDRKETKKPSTVTIECRAQLWDPEIGSTIRFKPSVGKQLSEGNWIVETIERKDISDNATTITVTRPQAAAAEKSQFKNVTTPKVVVSKGNPSGTIQNKTTGRLLESSVVWKIYEQAKWIGEQKFFYLYGGGHGGFHADPLTRLTAGLTPLKGEGEGLDCSGALSWCLHSAGAWPEPPIGGHPFDTHELETLWGAAGPGQYVTLWVTNSTKQEHCYLEIIIPSTSRPEGGPNIEYEFEASHTGATEPAPHGVGLRPRYRGTIPGFTPRHWPGT